MNPDPFPLPPDKVSPLEWTGDCLRVLDQRLLPSRIAYLDCRSAEDVAEATRSMALRGAPLIGVAAAFGMALAARRSDGPAGLSRAAEVLRRSRPTAVNLFHAVEHMLSVAHAANGDFADRLRREAEAYWKRDFEANRTMARTGSALLKRPCRVITYCNAGALATSGLGTSLGMIRYAFHEGKIEHVYPCETRPYLQGSRLTLWELMQCGIPATLITDNMAGHLMKTRPIGAVIVGSDRIAANGDVCNKIGTYMLAVLARHHRIPFYVVAPTTTVDFSARTGAAIPIEERNPDEVLTLAGQRIAPAGARAHHFAFDVTPRELVTAIVTEKGVVRPVNNKKLKEVVVRR
ncbi:MAG: S-methyl-5-thioribose-1-phosphate isomerase [Elusimicrobia bacterium]|nr:S-methyl-5-thioribose-1-phosphate isomerase [Elusimicrobiota bacterium]